MRPSAHYRNVAERSQRHDRCWTRVPESAAFTEHVEIALTRKAQHHERQSLHLRRVQVEHEPAQAEDCQQIEQPERASGIAASMRLRTRQAFG